MLFFNAPPRLLEYIEESNRPLQKSSSTPSSSSSSGSDNFNQEFLSAQNNIPKIVPSISPPSSISPSKPERDKNPFNYRNLRPIGGNTLLVKRLQSITYPGEESTEKGKGIIDINGKICLYVRGDNPDVSLDSRTWGCLDEDLVVGRPLLRVLPLNRIGFVQ